MNERIHTLRTLALKLNVSGTAEVLDEQRLYKGSYGFVKMQVYAPVTQNTDAPVCTAFCTTTDTLGREQTSTQNHRLWYAGDYEIGGAKYLLFEAPLPKEFTERETAADGLRITINYYDTAPTTDPNTGEQILDNNGVPTRHTTALLVSSRYTTTVYPGGWNDDSVELDINSAEAAQIGENMRDIAVLIQRVNGLNNFLVDAIGEIGSEHDRAVEAERYLSDRIDAAMTEIENTRNLGDFAGTFDTVADLPQNKSAFPRGLTVYDFVSVRTDSDHADLATRYVVDAIDGAGNITWRYDLTYQTDITGKIDKKPTATADDFIAYDERGNGKDSGYSGADIDRAQATADEAKAIALERDNSRVFETVADMQAWLAIPANAASLVIGASLFILDEDAPDYWWTGTEAEEYHDKTDLTGYDTREQTDAKRAAMRQQLIEEYQLAQTIKTEDDTVQRVVTLYKAEYNALPYKDEHTLYIVPDDDDPSEQALADRVADLEARVAALENSTGGQE